MVGVRGRSLLFFTSLLLVFLCVEGTRPALQSSDYWLNPGFVFGTSYLTAVARLDFDDDLWVAADSFLCGKAEKSCLPLDCVPCDWSGQDPKGCLDTDCCGPAQVGDSVYDNVGEWCEDPPLHNYTSLRLDRPSSLVTLEQGEIAYFRFYVGEENICRPIKIAVRPTYGVPTVRVSNLHAWPDTENSEWRRGSFPIGNLGLAQNYVTVCPVVHTNYRLGTYSIAVQAALSTQFSVEAFVSSQSQPLLPPSIRLSCSVVPDDEFSDDAAETFCLEDGLTVSHEFIDSRNEYSELVLPIPEGCFTVSVSATLEDSSGEVDLYCLPRDPDSLTTLDNSLIGRTVMTENRLSFSACFEETTFVHCTVFPKTENTVHMIFSTVSLPHRVPLFTSEATSLTYQDALTAAGAVFFGTPQSPCIDYLTNCYEWVSAPSTDPLIYFPPPSQLPRFNAPLDMYDDYGDTILASPLSKSLFVVAVVSYADETPFPITQLLTQGSLAVLTVTNRLGEPLNLPMGGVDSSNKQSVSKYIPHIPYSSLTLVELDQFCDEEDYAAYQELLQELIQTIEDDNTITTVNTATYATDVYNSAIASSSCVLSAVGELNIFMENISRTDQTFCRYDQVTQSDAYERDPCCNSELSPVACCFPFSADVEDAQASPPQQEDLEGLCGVPECAVSYFGDLSTALNQLDDAVQGCSSGILDPDEYLADLVNSQYENVVRYCLNLVGLSDTFQGTNCQVDSDCGEGEDATCDFLKGKCILPTTSQIENEYLACYIDRMPSSLEDYIRREVLPASESELPIDSEEFFDALREAASVQDCVNSNDPLVLDKRARYLWDAESTECKAEQLGLTEEDTEGIENACPVGICLGQSCRQDYSNCFANCNAGYNFADSDETCAPEPICSVSGLDSCSGSHCVYCPSDHSHPCTLVEGVSEDDCKDQLGCELPDGRVLFGLTEEECRARDISCTVNCPGGGCLSLSDSTGVCVVDVLTSPTCQNVAKTYSTETLWFEGEVCLITAIGNEDACQDFEDLSLLSTFWDRCEGYTETECGDVSVSVTQKFMACFVSDWRECQNQQECETAGECSDREYATIVRSETEEYPISVQTGVCFNSGFYDVGGNNLPTCDEDMDRPGIGCRDLLYDEESQCSGSFVSGGEYPNREWVVPAFTEEQCQNDVGARFGCLLPGPEKQLLWLNASECDCRGGESQYAWEWTQGQWRGGIPRSLTWMEAENEDQYEEVNSLSFLALEAWVADSVEEQFLYILRSDVICQSNFISYSLTTLVCDCFSGNEDGEVVSEGQCYAPNENSRENLMGISAVCAGETSAVKGPSGNVAFAEFSASEGCSLLNLSIVNQAWFDAIVADVAVSFRFEDHEPRGTVRNSNQATVGELVGDGTVISFEKKSRIRSFRACLRASQTEPSNSKYSERDFGSSTSDYDYIEPLGVTGVSVEEVGNAEFWCSRVNYDDVAVDSDGVVRLFPVFREEDYEDEDEKYVSKRTKVLMYVLGCFYAVDLLLFIYYFAHKAEIGRRSAKRRQIAFPLSVLFSILCVFRICFMFMYPNGVFYQEPLSEFIVFEIPTFLLFTMVITSIGFWKSLSNRSHFFVKDSTYLVYVGVVMVWCLWVVVTVVYSEVILETDSGKSPCVGRVPDSNGELEENTRILTIVYQSIIVVVTLLLALVFLFYTRKLLAAAKNISRVKKFILFIGGMITFSFLVRCILYVIILAVEFTSSIYMFIALFLTEALLMFACALQFNNLFFIHFGSTTSGRSSTGGHRSSSKSSDSKPGPRTDMSTVMDD